MKSYRKELWFNAPERMHFTNITHEIRECLAESGISEGLVLVNAMHITASVFINDDESGLHSDYKKWLEKLAPHEPVSGYRHNDTGEETIKKVNHSGANDQSIKGNGVFNLFEVDQIDQAFGDVSANNDGQNMTGGGFIGEINRNIQ